MSAYTMIFLIVTVAIAGDVLKRIATHKGAGRSAEDMGRISALEDTVRRLEQRLANVETIVTDKDYDLKRAFEDLKQ